MPRWVLRVLVTTALAAAAVWLARRALAEPPLEVAVVTLERGSVRDGVVNTKAGSVRARRSARVAPEIAGEVAALDVERGARVERGQRLLALEDSVLRAQFELSQRQLDVLRTQLGRACIARDRAKRTLERNRELAERGLLASDELDRLESDAQLRDVECSIASAEVARGEAQVALAQAELARCALLAPFDGVVSEVTVELGERVLPLLGSALASGAIELYDPATLHVTAPMDEVDSASLHNGARVLVSVDSHPGRPFPGRITAVAPYVLDVEQQNRTIEIEVELDLGGAAGLLPGTSADVEVVIEERENVWRLPTAALQPGGNVWVIEDGRLALRRVERGLSNWEWTEVGSGLTPDERVVLPRGDAELAVGREVVVAGEARP